MNPTRKTSAVWNEFICVNDVLTSCRVCKKKISFKGGSTANLYRHLRTMHPTLHARLTLEQRGQEGRGTAAAALATPATPAAAPTPAANPEPRASAPPSGTRLYGGQTRLTDFIQKPMPPMQQRSVDDALMLMFTKDLQPFSMVEDTGFRAYTKALHPWYVPPSRKTISKVIMLSLYEKTKVKVMDKVSQATAICLTTDGWTSRTTTSFLAVTAHFIHDFEIVSCLLDCIEFSECHTAANMAEFMRKIVIEWGIEDKIVACATDNAKNMILMVKVLGWTHQPCFAHTLNLVVKCGLKVISATVGKVKTIVEYFHKSCTSAKKLHDTLKQMDLPDLKLIQECPTRWNSTFYMLERVYKLKDGVIATLALVNPKMVTLTEEEWLEVAGACEVLSPFEDVTREVSADK